VNFGKSGLSSVSFGGRGVRHTVGAGGRQRTSVGVPGTGFSVYRTTSSRQQPAQRPQPSVPSPGFFASAAEKSFHAGVLAFLQDDADRANVALRAAMTADPKYPSPYLIAGIVAWNQGDLATATTLLESVVQNAQLPDQLMAKYLPGAAVTVPITARVSATAAMDSLGPPLILAELYQRTGRREEAIGLMQQLYQAVPGPAIALSLADLLYEDGDDEAVIELAAGVTNDSDLALGLLHLKAKALLRSGVTAGAVSEFSACLKKTSGRDPELLREIRYDRAAAYEQLGQASKARADWEKLYAEDPSYRDVRERVRGP
jgi:tetratricopeptide (TPR) repeat protein